MPGVLKRPASAASKCDRSLGHGCGPTLSELRAMHITDLRHHAGRLGVRIYEADGSKPPKKRRKDEMLKDIEHKLEHAASLDAPGSSSHGYPSVGDFERITPIEGFRAAATSFGLEVSRGGKNRSKKDIVADYQQKLNDLRSEALGSDVSSSSREKAAGSPSSLSVAVQCLEGTPPGASAFADMFSSEESSSSGSLRCYVCNIPVKTGVPCGKHSDCPHVACSLTCMLKLEMMWLDIKSGVRSLESGGRHVVNSASMDGLETSDVSSRPDDLTFSSSQSSCSSANAGIAVPSSCSSSSTRGVRKTCLCSKVDRVEPRADSLEQAQYLVAAAASLAEARVQQCGPSSLVSEESDACEECTRMIQDPSAVSSRPDDLRFSSSQSSCSFSNAGISVPDSCSSSSTRGVRKTWPSSNVDRVEPRADSLEQAQYVVAAAASLAESRVQQCGPSSLVSEASEACEECTRMIQDPSAVSSRPDDLRFSSSQSSCSFSNAGISVPDSCSSSSTRGVRKTWPSSNVDRVEPRADSLEQAQYVVAAAASLAESRVQQCGPSSLVSEASEGCEERTRMTQDPSSCAGSSCAAPPSGEDVEWLRSAISQLEGKGDITSFRAKVCDLGLVGHIPKGFSGGVIRRSKKDIIDDLKHRLARALCVHSDLLTHGVSVQSGPCQCSQEDSVAGAVSQDTVTSTASEVKQQQLRRDRQARKTYSQSAKGKFAKQVSNKKQRQRLQYREYDKNRKQQPEQKEKDIARLGTEHEKQKARARMSTVKKTVRRCHKKQKVDVHSHTERVYANRVHFTVENGGTWRETAERLAKAEGVSTENYPVVMPPSFAGLHNTKSLKHISEMYQYFEQTTWPTCVGCWRGWYHVPDKFSFGMVKTKAGGDKQWYQPGLSTLLRFIQSSLNTLGRHL